MYILYETPIGYSLFHLKDSSNNYDNYTNISAIKKDLSLKSFHKFSNVKSAIKSAYSITDSMLNKDLKSFLNKNICKVDKKGILAVYDKKLGLNIKNKLGLTCIYDSSVLELMRSVKADFENMINDTNKNVRMTLALSHSISTKKIKLSPDKIDTMIIQAISLLDDVDQELNNYFMRIKEWYGWHFPELFNIVNDNITYVKIIKRMGLRSNIDKINLLEIKLEKEMEEKVRKAAKISVGTDISKNDIKNILDLSEQILEINNYKSDLNDYLVTRMQKIAPNLSVLVGEIVGARLIARAGSLIKLSKNPASTIQVLGAEKALFRAIKNKSNTPKYGLIFYAKLVNQASAKNKGKIARVLANKTALALRVDVLSNKKDGINNNKYGLKLYEAVYKILEKTEKLKDKKKGRKQKKYIPKKNVGMYNNANDFVLNNKKRKNLVKVEKNDLKGNDQFQKKIKKE